jgi:hypothetical protein
MQSAEIIKTIIAAVISFVVPAALKQFWPKPKRDVSLPSFKWCVAGFAGGALGGLASGILGIMGAGARGFGNWAAFGTAVGLLQWLALRGYRPVGTWFIFASMVGWTLFILGGVWGWAVSGLAIGILQYLGLTNWKGAAWWIVANPIAWSIAGLIGVVLEKPLLGANPVLGWIVGWGIVGLVGAVVLLLPLSRLAEE